MVDCIPATGSCGLPSVGPCLPIHPRSDTIAPLKDLYPYPSKDGVTILWRVETNIQPPDQKILIRVHNERTGVTQQTTAVIWRGDGVGYIDFVPDALVGDKYQLYIMPYTDSLRGYWQHLQTSIPDLTGPPQVVQSVVARNNPYQILVTFDRPVVIDSLGAVSNMSLTHNGVLIPIDHVETLTQYPHSTMVIGSTTPFYKGELGGQWVYNGSTTITGTDGTEVATGVPYLITNNSQLIGRAFSNGFSLGFS